MLEFIICSMLTILPDFLIRRYGQGKRIGHEITLYSVWFELRYGITACAIMTISLITVVFFYHPAAEGATAAYRTVTILPETPGRVTEVMVANGEHVEAGDVLFQLDKSRQEAALETARSRLDEIDAEIVMAAADLQAAEATVNQAEAVLTEYQTELARTQQLIDRGSSAVSQQDLDRQRARADAQAAAVEAARSQAMSARSRVETLLPAQRASADASVRQAEVELDLTTIRATAGGTMSQFALQPGDYVNSIFRPAGLIVPDGRGSGRQRMQAGFGQLAAPVLKVGMVAEVACASVPFTIIPMVIVDIQDVIAGGAVRPTDQLIDIGQSQPPGSVLAIMEPLYEGGMDRVLPGSTCAVNAYTDNHHRLEHDESLTTLQKVGLHVVDTVGLAHAFILRIQALLLPVRSLVLSGGH
ncbi:HlyD family secretion protein [Marinibacterium profundimaris]|uniref:Secretion protein HlyD n=1 Tax=Marinibacterium profundimaris TaxID=1679460 RepID=A0A225NLQ3_9RHOB|nr:biotin/lipoyl-binding protein [Marinibacterium profundimaris]OWU72971.1 secretion protein HlyD [Marinibacterium profundimaris]